MRDQAWAERFTSVITRDTSLSELVGPTLDAHFEAIAAGTAQAPQPPKLEIEFESPEQELEARMTWLAWLRYGELVAALGLGADAVTVVHLAVGDVAIAGADGAPRLVIAEREAIVANAALLDALVGRELVIVGDAAELGRLADDLGDRRAGLSIVQVLIDRVPSMPAAAKLLHARYACPVGEVLGDPGGGWIAIAPRHGELLVQIRREEDVYVAGRTGDRVEDGSWGMLGTGRDGIRSSLGMWAKRQDNREGVPGLLLGVPETPLPSRGDLQLNIQDLHSLLGALPVFAYQLRLRDGNGSLLTISTVPGLDLDEAKTTVVDAIARGLDNFPIEFTEPGVEFDGARVDDRRVADLIRLVQVVWAGPEQSDARRGAWKVALVGAGVSGSNPVRLIDGPSGEACADPLALEMLATLQVGDRLGLRNPLEAASEDIVVIGPDATSSKATAWIRVLPEEPGRDGMLIAGQDRAAVERMVALFDAGVAAPELGESTVNGIHMQPYSRPTLAVARTTDDAAPFLLHADRCTGNGDCVRVCPTQAITLVEERPVIDASACIRCHLCSERCEQAALRPYLDADAFVDGRSLVIDAQRLARVRDQVRPRALAGKLVEPPASHDPRKAPATIKRKPTVVLGLATVTLMEHAAALLVDGELVAGVEEERLARVRHYSFEHPERPGASLSSEPCMAVEDAWPQRSIDAVLKTAGLTMDDVDVVAINGIPARFIHSFSGGGSWRPPEVMRANSIVYVPHHMSHAASVYGLSGFDDAWILSIDGRGDYETATIWRAEGHELEIIDSVPWLPDRSFGGVYETATRVLGFGTHGQGSTMALAALGEPTIDVSDCLGIGDDGVPILSEWNAEKRFAPYTRGYDDELTDEHKNFAASVQRALETTVAEYLAHHVKELRGQNLGMCGGVALNCRMNGTLRARFEPKQMHVPPGANDAGTAIGAALIGHRELTGELPRLDLGHTHFGPAWSDDAIARSLERMRVPFQRLRNVGVQTAELLAAGKILCWFQGPMEYGPRALGGRSIIADPRREDHKLRLNVMKSRQAWRPFGPSVLAGRQGDWFTHDWDSRFMLFAVDVRPEKREQIPVVVHADGSSRPQVVHREHHPRYHDMISEFERLTGVPMVVNTSFNRGGEPIVCNPAEAMRSFAGLGADAIVLGDCLVRRELLRRR